VIPKITIRDGCGRRRDATSTIRVSLYAAASSVPRAPFNDASADGRESTDRRDGEPGAPSPVVHGHSAARSARLPSVGPVAPGAGPIGSLAGPPPVREVSVLRRLRTQSPFSCANCELEITGAPTFHMGLPFCCAGCVAGGPCICSYDDASAEGVRHCLDVADVVAGSPSASPPALRRRRIPEAVTARSRPG
jgi:hypothetical protein